jgi:hypothetical protein
MYVAKRQNVIMCQLFALCSNPTRKGRKEQMKIEDKIYKLGLMAMDELLLHRNVSKETKMTIENASILADMIVNVGPQVIFTFNEEEIAKFYQVWGKERN